MSLAAGTRLGRYQVVGALGAGGMGEVYRARDERLDRDVAVKVLPEAVSADADRLARFEREAKALARIEHPNILTIHDFGQEAPATGASRATYFAVTELLTGETLRSRLARERLAWRRAVDIGAAVADGLAAAHGQGIVHRDLKPDNIFLTTDGRVKILDFGLATSGLVPDGEAPTQMSPGAGSGPGVVLGTVGYMAPEQVQAAAVDGRADLFALGCVLYEMVTGQRAFARPTPTETLAAILSAPVPGGLGQRHGRSARTGAGSGAVPREAARAAVPVGSDLAFALRALLTAPVGVPASVLPAGGCPRRRLCLSRPRQLLLCPSPHLVGQPRRLPGPSLGARSAAPGSSAAWRRSPSSPPASQPPSALWPRASSPPASAGGLDPEKVVVAVFDNRTGDATLDSLGIMISDFVTQGLHRLEGIKLAENPMAVSGGPALPRSAVPAGTDPVGWLAERTGAGLVVTGAYYPDGTNIRAQSRLVDATTGRRIIDIEPVAGPRDTPSAVVDLLTQRVTGAVAVRLNRVRFGVVGLMRRAKVRRLPRILRWRRKRLAPTTRPRFPTSDPRLPWTLPTSHRETCCLSSYLNQGMDVEADEALRPMEEPAFFSKATPAEQAIIRYGIVPTLDGNRAATLAAVREVVRLMPDSGCGYNVGLSEERLNHPRAAAEAYAQVQLSTQTGRTQAQ